MSAIFSYAKQEQCFIGDNPAKAVRLTESIRKKGRALTLAETKEILGAMEYLEKEMTLIATLTGLNVVEICGLQWKYVNLWKVMQNADSETIPPRTMAVRNQSYRGELENVKQCRVIDIPIPQPLFQILLQLGSRAKVNGPEDFVFVSRAGTPINQTNLLERRLKPIAKQMRVPAMTWNLLLRTRKALLSELGQLFQFYMGMMTRSGSEPDPGQRLDWHCRPQLRQTHREQDCIREEHAPLLVGQTH